MSNAYRPSHRVLVEAELIAKALTVEGPALGDRAVEVSGCVESNIVEI